MYQFAYPLIADEPVSPPPLTNSQKVSLALELIDAAGRADCTAHERMTALSNFRRIWISIADALSVAPGAQTESAQLILAALSQSIISEIDACRMYGSREKSLQRKRLS